MNADGTGTTRLTSTKENDTHPTWSPDGSQIAFARDGDIYVMNADGSNARRISDTTRRGSPIRPGRPTVSGSRTCAARPGTAVREVWVMRPDGSERHRADVAERDEPSRRPGRPTARASCSRANEDGEVYELFTIGVDGKGLRQRRADGRRQLRAVVVTGRDEDRLPGGRRDLHRRARRRRRSSTSPTARTTTRRPAWNPQPPARATSSAQKVP